MRTNNKGLRAAERQVLPIALMSSALLVTGCLGGGSSGGSISSIGDEDPVSTSINAANAGYVSRLADGLVRGGGGLDGLAEMLAAGNMELPVGGGSGSGGAAGAQASIQSTETEDCPSGGSWSRTESEDGVVVVYDQCVSEGPAARHEADGTVRIEAVPLRDDYTLAQQFSFESMRLSVLVNDDSRDLVFDGSLLNERRAADDYRQTADYSIDQSLDCKSANISLAATQDFVTVVEPGAPGVVIVVNGSGSTSGSSRFEGRLTVETLDPVRIAEPLGGQPFQGELRVTAEDGSSVTLKYVEGGVYVDEQLYSWAEYANRFVDDPITDLSCFVDEPADPGNIAQGMRATINGTAWSADANVSNATLGGPLNVLAVVGIDPSSTSNFSISISLQDMSGPGSYALTVPGDELHRFAVVSVVEGDLRWDAFQGGGGTVTVLSVGAGRVTGTFQFVAGPQATSNATGVLTIANGEFNLPLISLQ